MGIPTGLNMAALTTAEHQTAMDKLEAEKPVLSAQIEEKKKKLWALQSACTDLTNDGYLNRDPIRQLREYEDWPEDWTSQQRKEGDERTKRENYVDGLRSQLDNVASEVVKFTNMLADLQAEEVLKDEAKERRSALTRETEEIDDLIYRRKDKIRALQFEIDNPGMRAPMTDSFDELMKRLDRYESLADIERMIATQQRIINEKKLELTELDNQVALKEKELAEMKANPVTNLDSLCGDLQRVQAEFLPEEIAEPVWEIHTEIAAEIHTEIAAEPVFYEEACCRM